MTARNGTIKPATHDAEAMNREELIKMLSDVSKKLYLRISAKRFREREADQTLLAFTRAFSQTAQAMTAAMRDNDLTIIDERLQALEERETDKQHREKIYE